jgi:hypothetical protein
LKDGGEIGYIVPVTRETGARYDAFRSKFVIANYLRYLVNLPYDVFKDAYVDTCILIARKAKVQDPASQTCNTFEYKKRDKIKSITEILLEYEPLAYSLILGEDSNRLYT